MSGRANERPTRTTGSGEVEPIEVHDLVPRRHEVTHELLLRVVAGVDLREGAELGVRAEDEVDGGGGPLDLARRAVATLVDVLAESDAFHSVPMSSRFTKKSLVNVPGRSVKTPCGRLPDVGVQGAHAADEHRHLGRGQRQHVRPVQQQGLRRQLLSGSEVVAEPVRGRLEHGERLDVGLLLRGVGAPRRERDGDVVPGVLRRLLDGRAAAQHDQVGERDLRSAGLRRG